MHENPRENSPEWQTSQILEKHRAVLERIQALDDLHRVEEEMRAKENNYLRLFGEPTRNHGPSGAIPTPDRGQSSFSSRLAPTPTTATYRDRHHDLKFSNIDIFTRKYTIQQRHSWLVNLDLAFSAAPYRYDSERNRVLGGIQYMDSWCRTQWSEYVRSKDPITRSAIENNWQAFEDWTLTLISNSVNLRSTVMAQIEQASQGEKQDPRDFHTYLHSLEQHLPQESEENRALKFYVKLQPKLQETMGLHCMHLPKQREEMVDLAVHTWKIINNRSRDFNDKKRKGPNDQSNSFPSKRSFKSRNFHEKPTERPRFSRKPDYRPGPSNTPASGSNKNPVNRDGKQTQCFICHSKEHWANKCPRSSQRVQEVVEATEAAGVAEVSGEE